MRIGRTAAAVAVALMLAAQAQVYVSAPQAGAAAPSEAQLMGGVSSGNLAALAVCDNSAFTATTTATTLQAVAVQAGKSIHVCGFVANAGGATTARLVQGTGTNCGTGQSNLTPAFNLASGGSISFGNGMGRVLRTNAGSALCVTSSAAVALNVLITYTQY